MVAKAEWLAKGENPRFVVTSLSKEEAGAQYLYETLYCARGDMENRIKECQLALFADRTSSATLRANQLRLHFASFAYALLHGLRRLAQAGRRGHLHRSTRQNRPSSATSQGSSARYERSRTRPKRLRSTTRSQASTAVT